MDLGQVRLVRVGFNSFKKLRIKIYFYLSVVWTKWGSVRLELTEWGTWWILIYFGRSKVWITWISIRSKARDMFNSIKIFKIIQFIDAIELIRFFTKTDRYQSLGPTTRLLYLLYTMFISDVGLDLKQAMAQISSSVVHDEKRLTNFIRQANGLANFNICSTLYEHLLQIKQRTQ